MTYAALGRYDDAEKAFKRAVVLDEKDVCAYRELGGMYYELRKYPEAIIVFKRLSEFSPSVNTYMYLGNSYVYAEEYETGADVYKKAIGLDPKNAFAHLQLGIAYYYLDRREEALAEYKEAAKLDPDNKHVHHALALAYLDLHNQPAAQAEYEILRNLDPDNVAESFEDFEFAQLRESGKEKLYLIPLNNFSTKSLQRLVAYYKEKNGIDVITTAPLPLRLAAVDKRRQQLIAEDVIEYMKTNYPNYVLDPNAIIIGVTDEDMYIRKRNSQYAFSYRSQGRFAVVSSARMNPLNFGEPANNDLLESRMRKMILKNIGILYYQYPTNHDPTSVLYEGVESVKDLDKMGEDF
jgi:tetratricopeptide (TPR) repeat protein